MINLEAHFRQSQTETTPNRDLDLKVSLTVGYWFLRTIVEPSNRTTATAGMKTLWCCEGVTEVIDVLICVLYRGTKMNPMY